jgi:hypothetical protein
VVVRYRVRPEALDENLALVRAVYAELAATKPEGLRYSTYRVNDRDFVHVAVLDAEENPLDGVAAFSTFLERVADRCEEGPTPSGGEVVGSYG